MIIDWVGEWGGVQEKKRENGYISWPRDLRLNVIMLLVPHSLLWGSFPLTQSLKFTVYKTEQRAVRSGSNRMGITVYIVVGVTVPSRRPRRTCHFALVTLIGLPSPHAPYRAHWIGTEMVVSEVKGSNKARWPERVRTMDFHTSACIAHQHMHSVRCSLPWSIWKSSDQSVLMHIFLKGWTTNGGCASQYTNIYMRSSIIFLFKLDSFKFWRIGKMWS